MENLDYFYVAVVVALILIGIALFMTNMFKSGTLLTAVLAFMMTGMGLFIAWTGSGRSVWTASFSTFMLIVVAVMGYYMAKGGHKSAGVQVFGVILMLLSIALLITQVDGRIPGIVRGGAHDFFDWVVVTLFGEGSQTVIDFLPREGR